MNGVNKVGTALIVVFAVLLVSLIAELFYVLYRRRRFRRQSLAGGDQNFAGNPSNSPSKELLYFFCWKNESRVEPQEAPQPPPRHAGHDAATTEVDDVLKWQRLYGPSRVLFTIKEEDREGAESENFSSAEKGTRAKTARSEEERVGLGAGTLAEVAVTIEIDEATPFSTPCASPPYYTPWASPSREVDSLENNEEFSVPYVSLEGHVV